MTIVRRTTPPPREVRKTKTDPALPEPVQLGHDKLTMAKIKLNGRTCFEVRMTNPRGTTTRLFRQRRFKPAKRFFERRVRAFAIKAALDALGVCV